MSGKIYSPDGEEIGEIVPQSTIDNTNNCLTFVILLILAGIGFAFRSVFKFIFKHSFIIAIIYFAILTFIAFYAYYKSNYKFKFIGAIATICNYAPLYLYFKGLIPWLLSHKNILEFVFNLIYFFIPTCIVLLILLGVTMIAIKTENGIWHMVFSAPLLALAIYMYSCL